MTIEARKLSDSARTQRTLSVLRRAPRGLSIYALAQKLSRPYRRVFDTVRRLQRAGAVRVEPAVVAGRRVSLVFAGEALPRGDLRIPAHLTELERRLIAALAARLAAASPRILAIVLFGSRARARSTVESDLDLAVLVAGRRDVRLEERVVSLAAEAQWQPPFEGTPRLGTLVLFTGERRMPLSAALQREGITLWTRPI